MGNTGVTMPVGCPAEIVTVAAADFVESAALTAVMVTAAGLGTDVGAVNSPLLLMIPHVAPEHPEPVADQVTLVFELPVTLALNCWATPTATEGFCGDTVTATTEFMVTAAAADFVASATLVAVTLTAAGAGAVAGAE